MRRDEAFFLGLVIGVALGITVTVLFGVWT